MLKNHFFSIKISKLYIYTNMIKCYNEDYYIETFNKSITKGFRKFGSSSGNVGEAVTDNLSMLKQVNLRSSIVKNVDPKTVYRQTNIQVVNPQFNTKNFESKINTQVKNELQNYNIKIDDETSKKLKILNNSFDENYINQFKYEKVKYGKKIKDSKKIDKFKIEAIKKAKIELKKEPFNIDIDALNLDELRQYKGKINEEFKDFKNLKIIFNRTFELQIRARIELKLYKSIIKKIYPKPKLINQFIKKYIEIGTSIEPSLLVKIAPTFKYRYAQNKFFWFDIKNLGDYKNSKVGVNHRKRMRVVQNFFNVYTNSIAFFDPSIYRFQKASYIKRLLKSDVKFETLNKLLIQNASKKKFLTFLQENKQYEGLIKENTLSDLKAILKGKKSEVSKMNDMAEDFENFLTKFSKIGNKQEGAYMQRLLEDVPYRQLVGTKFFGKEIFRSGLAMILGAVTIPLIIWGTVKVITSAVSDNKERGEESESQSPEAEELEEFTTNSNITLSPSPSPSPSPSIDYNLINIDIEDIDFKNIDDISQKLFYTYSNLLEAFNDNGEELAEILKKIEYSKKNYILENIDDIDNSDKIKQLLSETILDVFIINDEKLKETLDNDSYKIAITRKKVYNSFTENEKKEINQVTLYDKLFIIDMIIKNSISKQKQKEDEKKDIDKKNIDKKDYTIIIIIIVSVILLFSIFLILML